VKKQWENSKNNKQKEEINSKLSPVVPAFFF